MASTPLPRSTPRNDPAVEAAYEAASDELVAEILDGELHTLPRPRPRHARAATRLGGMLRGFDGEPSGDDPGGWILLHEPELHLGTGPDKVVPDLAGWRRERFPRGALDASGGRRDHGPSRLGLRGAVGAKRGDRPRKEAEDLPA